MKMIVKKKKATGAIGYVVMFTLALMMVVEVKCGVSLCTNLVNFDLSGASNIYKCILITVQMSITPIVISGLVKGSDSIIARMF